MISVTGASDRFNLSVVGADFINDCCFGEDFSSWLVKALRATGVEADVICMEDFGWANYAVWHGVRYLVSVAGSPDKPGNPANHGEWHVMLERQRTLIQTLLGKGKITLDDPLVGIVHRILHEGGFTAVRIEP